MVQFGDEACVPSRNRVAEGSNPCPLAMGGDRDRNSRSFHRKKDRSVELGDLDLT